MKLTLTTITAGLALIASSVVQADMAAAKRWD